MHGLFSARHYSDYVDQMLVWLTSQKKSLDPGQRGTAFYFLGIAAFACHDYQSATFFFDAAASEDFKVADTENQPAHLFMCLDPSNPNQAGREIVLRIVGKLNQAIDDYNRRTDAISISDSIVRANFLRPQMRHRHKTRRTLITTFISFIAEWDYLLQTIELNIDGSKEPFFTHLFRGCLLFESLLKNSKEPPPKKGRPTLGDFLRDGNFKQRLGIGAIVTSCDDFGALLRALKTKDRSPEAAIQCTAQVRNTLGHNLVWAAQRLNRKNYDLLANDIASACLHAISTLYVREAAIAWREEARASAFCRRRILRIQPQLHDTTMAMASRRSRSFSAHAPAVAAQALAPWRRSYRKPYSPPCSVRV